MDKEIIRLGIWSEESLDRLIRAASEILAPGERIAFIAEEFPGTVYEAHTLTGDQEIPEALVINLEGMDCFTFIDYVEAMRISRSFSEFKENLKRVRYKGGEVSFFTRNHFFSDWALSGRGLVEDVTGFTGGAHCRFVRKTLNAKEDGSLFLPGLPPVEREIGYIQAALITDDVEERLSTGDYVGIYTETPGLDVSHVGIFIREGGRSYFRHASSPDNAGKVVDQDFRTYVAAKPGIVVLRPVGL